MTLPQPIVIDEVWMIVGGLPDQKPEIIYGAPATNAEDAWNNVIRYEIMGTGSTKEWLKAKGFKAKKVMICI
jgi:hypothetical protein